MSDLEAALARGDVSAADLAGALPTAAFAVGPDGVLQWWSDRFADVTGYGDDALRDRRFVDLLPAADAERVGDTFDQVREHGGTATPRTHVVTADGDPWPVSLRVSRLDAHSDAALLGVVRDDVDHLAEPGAVDAAREADDADDARETDLRRERELEMYERLVEAAGDGIYAVDADGRVVMVNEQFADLVGVSKDRLLASHPSVLRDEGVVGRAAYETGCEAVDRLFDGEDTEVRFEVPIAADGEDRVVECRAAALTEGGEPTGAVCVVRDVTERAQREREVAASRDELRTLVRINAVVQEVIGALVTAASRDEIEETVCERLQESALYQSAWIGEPNPSGEGIVPRVGVGVSDRFLDQVPEMDASREWNGPASRALATGDIQVIANLVEAEGVPEPVRAEALARGVRSVVSVPLSYGDTVYGFLTVGATRPDAFSEREQSAFLVLGEVIGFAINAVQSKQLLLSDATTELEFRTSDDDSVVVRASAVASCRLTLDGMVPVGDGTLLCYASVSGADPAEVVSAVRDADGVEDARTVSEGSDGSIVELAVSGESVMHALTQRGAHVRSMEAEDGRATLTVAVAPGVDVRSLVEHVQSTFPDLRLVAKQDVERSRRDPPGLRRALDDRLTERQRAALRAAYHGGYFEWPRGSTAEELADAMDISSPTFHQHLRAAQRKLLSVFLDVEAGDGAS